MSKYRAFLIWVIVMLSGVLLLHWRATKRDIPDPPKSEAPVSGQLLVVGTIKFDSVWTTNGDGRAVVATKNGDVHVIIVGTPPAGPYPATEVVLLVSSPKAPTNSNRELAGQITSDRRERV